MTPLVGRGHPLHRLFSGLVEQVFHVEIGICDPSITDYLEDLLLGFVHVDQIYSLRRVNHEVIREVSRMAADATLGPDVDEVRRRRLVHKHIGDFTLFWTGVYPESLHPRRHSGADRLAEYLLAGKQSYGIASELTRGEDVPPAGVLHQLSEQFEYCVHGLHLVRAGWERLLDASSEN